jgi:hypothetical protein
MGKRRRIIVRACILLVLGAIINVAVAWGCAALNRPTRVSLSVVANLQHREGTESWQGRSYRGWGRLWISITRQRSNLPTHHPWLIAMKRSQERAWNLKDGQLIDDLLPAWCELRYRELPEESWVAAMQTVNATGWPMLTLWSERSGTGPTIKNVSLALLGGLELNQGKQIDLPIRVIWPGFAINTVLYATILWVLFGTPGAVRRRLRNKRGQCASCGYSLRESVSDKCPECGALTGD